MKPFPFWRSISYVEHGYPVINGDESDLRQLDPRAAIGSPGFVVGLSPKGGKAKRDTSGFVV